MSGPISERFIIGRQGYVRFTDIQGRLESLDPQSDFIDAEDDPEACAQMVVDLACEDPGIIFTVSDTRSGDHIAVFKGDMETREELLRDTREAMQSFTEAADLEQGTAAPSAD